MTQGGYPGIGRATEGLVMGLLGLDTGHRFLLLYQAALPIPPRLKAAMSRPHRLVPIPAALRSLGDQVGTPLRLRRHGADLLHATYFAGPIMPGVPCVVSVYDLIPVRYPAYWPVAQGRVIRAWLRWSSARAARVVAPSLATMEDLRLAYGLQPQRRALVPLAAGIEVPPAGEPVGPSARTYLLCVCTNKPHKNLTRLVQAYGSLLPDHPELPCLVLAGGWDPRYPDAERAAAAVNRTWAGRVRLVRNPSDAALADLYRGALGFIFPSEYEGFGLPVLEAMQAGLPVAASTTPAVAEIAGGACLGFDPHDTAAMAASILRLARDPELRRRLSQEGMRRAAVFSWRTSAAALLAVYQDVLKGRTVQR